MLADRRFDGGQFFKWLAKQAIPFYIRIMVNANGECKGEDFEANKISALILAQGLVQSLWQHPTEAGSKDYFIAVTAGE